MMMKKSRRSTKKGRKGRWAKRAGSHHEGGLKFLASVPSKELKKLSARSSRRAANAHLKTTVAVGDIENVDSNPNPFGKPGHGSWWD